MPKISWFDMWFNIVKPRFLFKTVDLWSYINAQLQLLAYALNPIESGFPQILSAFQDLCANSVKRSQTQLDLERMKVAEARNLCRIIGPLLP